MTRWSRLLAAALVLVVQSCSEPSEPSPTVDRVTVGHLQTASAELAVYRRGTASRQAVPVYPRSGLHMMLPSVKWQPPSSSARYVLLIVSSFGWLDQYWELAQGIVLRSDLEVVAVMPGDGRGLVPALGLSPAAPGSEVGAPLNLASLLHEAGLAKPHSIVVLAGDADLVKDMPSSRVIAFDSSSPPAGSFALYTTSTPFSLLASPAVPPPEVDLPFAVANVEAGLGVIELSAVCGIEPSLGETINAQGIGNGIGAAVTARCTKAGRAAAARLVSTVAALAMDYCVVPTTSVIFGVFNESKLAFP